MGATAPHGGVLRRVRGRVRLTEPLPLGEPEGPLPLGEPEDFRSHEREQHEVRHERTDRHRDGEIGCDRCHCDDRDDRDRDGSGPDGGAGPAPFDGSAVPTGESLGDDREQRPANEPRDGRIGTGDDADDHRHGEDGGREGGVPSRIQVGGHGSEDAVERRSGVGPTQNRSESKRQG